MSPSSTPARLAEIPLFQGLDAAALERIAAIGTEVALPAGRVIIERGQPGAGLYVIEDGVVSVELRDRTVELGPGECVGELSLLVADTTRSARVRSLTPVSLLAIGRSDFDALLESEPPLAVALLRTVARRLVAMIAESGKRHH
ncbi:MAG: cyclic nucleotide-binding domain-containing protein [Gaiellales bacterium]